MKIFQRLPLWLVLLSATLSLPAQTAKPNFNRARAYDVRHYLIKTGFDRANKRLSGETTVSLKPLRGGFRTLELDAVGLVFESVVLDATGADLPYRVTSDKIVVTLDRAYAPAETVAVRLKYTAQPRKGVYFIDAETVENGKTRPAQIWTQGEPEESRHWFPSFDFPDDKATSEQMITVEQDETAISNGELLAARENADGTKTFHYRMNQPHPVYLISFVVGRYVRLGDRHEDTPLGYYLYPGREYLAQKAFGNTKEMMRIFEELTGVEYPFDKYDQTIVARFPLGGMENITATTLSDQEIFYADFPFAKEFVEDLISHELSHSWFGNLVTCRNWAELWLNEGFATFMEAAYREKKNGRADYIRKIKADVEQYFAEDVRSRRPHGLYNLLARPDDSIFDAINYQKGGAVVHTLRETVGDEIFWRAINTYLNRHQFGSVETADLQRVFEETSKQDLDWFFKQWVDGTGYPKIDVAARYNRAAKTLIMTFRQTQKIADLTPAAFILPLDVELETKSGPVKKAVRLTKRVETVTLKINEAPTAILIDKDEKIPLKQIKLRY